MANQYMPLKSVQPILTNSEYEGVLHTSFEEIVAFNPDGFFLSNGPGDPEPLSGAIEVAKEILKNNKPLFGICLGHQVIGLANGISTYKMFNGHRGINHPVKNILTT